MKILVVDDCPHRHQILSETFDGYDVTHAWNADEGVKAVRDGSFDLVLLDHDMEEVHYTDLQGALSGKGTGQEVAHEIANLQAPPFVVVHSWNHYGGKAICNILDDAGVPNERIWFSVNMATHLSVLGVT